MRTYTRHCRPDVERALHQVVRGRLPQCPRCDHPVVSHALDDQGRRVCTRGAGRVACRDCARFQAAMAAPALAMFHLAQCMQLAPRQDWWKTLILT